MRSRAWRLRCDRTTFLILGDLTGPGKELHPAVVLGRFATQNEVRLLEHLVGDRPCPYQREDVAVECPLAGCNLLDLLQLVAGIGRLGRIWHGKKPMAKNYRRTGNARADGQAARGLTRGETAFPTVIATRRPNVNTKIGNSSLTRFPATGYVLLKARDPGTAPDPKWAGSEAAVGYSLRATCSTLRGLSHGECGGVMVVVLRCSIRRAVGRRRRG